MKKLFLFLVLAAISQTATPTLISANDYQGIRYATTEGKVYEHLSGQFAIAASTATSSTYTITMNGDGGLITASSATLRGSLTLTGLLIPKVYTAAQMVLATPSALYGYATCSDCTNGGTASAPILCMSTGTATAGAWKAITVVSTLAGCFP